MTPYSFFRLNSISSAGSDAKAYTSFNYDNKGNITNNSHFGMTYILANQMTHANGNSYTYDGFNRRVKTNSNEFSAYSQEGQLLFRQEGSIATQYMYLGSRLVAKKKSQTVSYLHTDILGSVIAETNGSKTVQSRSHYKAFGDTVAAPQDDVGYTSHKFDADLGLSYMQARYYDPVIGRFYSNDPVGYTAKNPVMSFNRYLYVNNNPYKYTDPDGEFLGLVQLAATVAGAVIGGAAEMINNPNADLGSVARASAVGAVVGFATSMPGMGALGTMAMGGAANAGGEMANQIATGDFDGTKVLVAGATGTIGGAYAKGAAKILNPGRGLANNTATQASHNMTKSSSQRVLADSKTLSSTTANRATSQVAQGTAYSAGSVGGTKTAEAHLNEERN